MDPQYTPTFLTLFWSRVDKNGPLHPYIPELGPCWIWVSGRFNKGYGCQWVHGKTRSTHRIVWEITFGPIPKGLWVLHSCDNPSCVRPNHLHLGTVTDNNREASVRNRSAAGERHGTYLHPETVKRGAESFSHLHPERLAHGERHGSQTHPDRVARGEKHGMAKLTEQQVREIRSRYIPRKVGIVALGLEYGVDHTIISSIIQRKAWRHVT